MNIHRNLSMRSKSPRSKKSLSTGDRRRRNSVSKVKKTKAKVSTTDIGNYGEDLVAGAFARRGLHCTFTKGSGRVNGDGDMLAGNFAIEVKTGKSVSLSHDRWNKTVAQAQKSRKVPMMVMVLTKDNKPPELLGVVSLEQLITLIK